MTDFMADPDVAEMLAFQGGEYQAFERLVGRHTDSLVNYFYFQCRDRHTAQDCSQDVWFKIFKSAGDYVPRARFRTFLFRVARNLWIDRVRTASRRPVETSIQGEGDGGDAPSLLDQLPAEGPGPDAETSRVDAARVVARALASLPEEMREVYILAEIEALPYAEVSAVLEIPVGTVKSRMFNAVRRLKQVSGRIEGES